MIKRAARLLRSPQDDRPEIDLRRAVLEMLDEQLSDAAGIGRRRHRRNREAEQSISWHKVSECRSRDGREASRQNAAHQADHGGAGAVALERPAVEAA